MDKLIRKLQELDYMSVEDLELLQAIGFFELPTNRIEKIKKKYKLWRLRKNTK